jgi:hypothetical protein
MKYSPVISVQITATESNSFYLLFIIDSIIVLT